MWPDKDFNFVYEYRNYWILLSNKLNILLPILKIKWSSYHIFTQNKRNFKLDMEAETKYTVQMFFKSTV
jgi:hypothetical protein